MGLIQTFLFLSPNDILVPNFTLESLASNRSPLHNVNLLIGKLQTYHLEMQQELEQTFLSDWRRFSPGYLKVHKSKKDLRPSEGDLVLVKGDKLNDLGRYGMVEKLMSPKTLLIRLRGD